MERQVVEAALAVVHPTTASADRARASSSLEQWTRSQDATTWTTYRHLLQRFPVVRTDNTTSHDDTTSALQLLFTMLHAKIRRDVRCHMAGPPASPTSPGTAAQQSPPDGHVPVGLREVRDEVVAALQRASHNNPPYSQQLVHGDPLIAQLCSTLAAIAVRLQSPTISELIHVCHGALQPQSHQPSQSPISSHVALRLLASLPTEAEECDMTAYELQETLTSQNMIETVSDTVRLALLYPMTPSHHHHSPGLHSPTNGNTNGHHNNGANGTENKVVVLALRALCNWARVSHVTISHLSAPPPEGGESLLTILVKILSQPGEEEILSSASMALTEAVLVPSDTCTPTRNAAVSFLLEAIPRCGFLVTPFAHATNMGSDDVTHAIAILAETLLTEEIDIVAPCQTAGCMELIELLLRIQSHPHQPVAITAMECWLSLQDVPTSERHPDLAVPLFSRLLDIIVTRVAYTPSFTTWEEELDLDSQEFEDFRRLMNDLLVSIYFLLRVRFIDQLVAVIGQGNWVFTESALCCLSSVSREVCARVKARAGGGSIREDRDATTQRLLQVLEQLCSGGSRSAAHQHPLVLVAVVNFIGSYASVWNVCCTADAIVNLLAYLRQSILESPTAAEPAAASSRLLYIGCASKLVALAQTSETGYHSVLTTIKETIDAILKSGNEAGTLAVVEGSTRLAVQLNDYTLMNQVLGVVMEPILKGSRHSIEVIRNPGDAHTLSMACQSLSICLRALKELIRFCDNPYEVTDEKDYPFGDILSASWPILHDVASSQTCRQDENILIQVLAVNEQLIRTVPDMVAPHFSQLMTFVVQAYEETHLPCTFDFVATAVEAFGSKNVESIQSFNQLLTHLSRCTYAYVTNEKRPSECPQVIRALFDMTRIYVLFSPYALVNCPEFSNLFSLAVACVHTECKGERDSTRAALIFLSTIIGWRGLRLSQDANAALEADSEVVHSTLAQHGDTIICTCIVGLSGGMPQMLWPALSDTLYATITHVLGTEINPSTEIKDNTMAHQWLRHALSNDVLGVSGETMPEHIKAHIMQILIVLAREGPKSKSRFKMLLMEFAQICKGEMNSDSLLSHSIQK